LNGHGTDIPQYKTSNTKAQNQDTKIQTSRFFCPCTTEFEPTLALISNRLFGVITRVYVNMSNTGVFSSGKNSLMKRSNSKIAAFIVLAVLFYAEAATTVKINGNDQGRAFEGIGAVSAGASTRLLIDYEDPYRSDILDFLFKPKFGAAFQHLKVEMGGGTNSTSGAEPSHAVTPEELKNPVARGYEFWFMAQARKKNPKILLDCLPWAFPYWLSDKFTQDSADYFTAFLKAAREKWQLELDWVAAAQNESGTDLDWVVNKVRPAMDAAGFEKVKIQAPDNSWDYWKVFEDFKKHPEYTKVIKAVGYHYIDQKEYPSEEVVATGIPLWSSEDSIADGTSWIYVRDMVARMNRYYIKSKITKMEIWCPVDSCADGINLCNVGPIQADKPWSGYYKIRPATWGIAHYTQFTETGWKYIDSGCGYLSGKGNFATLKNPKTGDWSIIIYSEKPEDITFELSGGLKQTTVHVWKSDKNEMFIKQKDIKPANGKFSIHCNAESLYSVTTTTGQQKGQPVHPIPANTHFPFPYSENFESYDIGATPKYYSDMQGTFEVAKCKGGRNGKCLQQIVPKIGYTWAPDWCNPPATMSILSSEMTWVNYEANIDVFIESGEVYLAARKGQTQKYSGYALVLGKNGQWRITYDDVTSKEAVLEKGTLEKFDSGKWHNLKLRCVDEEINAYIDGVKICSLTDARRMNGQVCFGSSFDLNQFDNLAVKPAGSKRSSWVTSGVINPLVKWSDGWQYLWDQAYIGGVCNYAKKAGETAEFTFDGQKARIIGLKRNDLGIMDVYVDGKLKKSVDCYSKTIQYQVILFESDQLEQGEHKILIKTTNKKNKESTNSYIALDGFVYLVNNEDTSSTASTINIKIYPQQKIREISPLFFGTCLMYHVEDDNAMSDGLIEKYLKEMPCTTLRFPGGTDSDGYLWDEHRLADKKRWPFKDGPSTMDTDEFISLCRRTGAEPLICVNTELAFFESPERAIKLAADWVSYCNKTKNYGVKYWEIGNEPYYHSRFDAKEYAELFVKMARAMKAVDSSIKIAAVGQWNVDYEGVKAKIPDELLKEAQATEYQAEQGNWSLYSQFSEYQKQTGPAWWPIVLETAGEQIDIVSIHWYFTPEKDFPTMTESIEKLRKLCRKNIPNKDIPIIMTEWNVARWVKTRGLQRALAVGEGAGRMLDAGVSIAHLWPLRCGGDHDVKNLLHLNKKTPTANYKVLQLFSKYIGQYRIPSKSNNNSVYHFASLTKSGELSVFLINRNQNEIKTEMKIKEYKGGKVTLRLLKSEDAQSSDDITLEENTKIITGDTINILIPPYSMYQLTFVN